MCCCDISYDVVRWIVFRIKIWPTLASRQTNQWQRTPIFNPSLSTNQLMTKEPFSLILASHKPLDDKTTLFFNPGLSTNYSMTKQPFSLTLLMVEPQPRSFDGSKIIHYTIRYFLWQHHNSLQNKSIQHIAGSTWHSTTILQVASIMATP